MIKNILQNLNKNKINCLVNDSTDIFEKCIRI